MSDRLRREIAVERELLNRLLANHSELMERCAKREPDSVEISALAAMLHSFRTGLENALKRIAVHVDQALPEGPARREPTGYVCPGPSGGQINRGWVTKAFTRAGKAAGLTKRVTPHVLRRTFGTLLAMSGAPLPAVANIMGHANLSTTAIYLHVSDEARRGAIAKLPRIPAEEPEQKVVRFGASAASGGKGLRQT